MLIPKIYLKSGRDQRVLLGHLWVFSNEIERIEGTAEPGAIIDIHSHRKHFLGRGFFNPHSLIAARILTRRDQVIDVRFFSKRIEKAKHVREFLFPGETAYRLIFGESDFMPGLVIDRFENCFVIQSYCLGMDLLTPTILDALKSHFKVDCIVRKNDSSIRELENLPKQVEVIEGQMESPMQISQRFGTETLRFYADPLEGQKTGFYFDQRENRERLAVYAPGKKVLDCFSHGGAFGVYAAKSGASEVISVDSGLNAAALIEKNSALNGVNATAIREDVFVMFERFRLEKRKFDIIILDPPAFAKSKKNLFGALRKYEKLNAMAISLLDTGGVLFSCSCSHHVGRGEFIQMLNAAADSQNRAARLLEIRGASRDHPVLPSMPETEYLKCAILKMD